MANRLSLEMMMNREQLELQIKKEELKRDQCNINIDRWKKQLAEKKVLSGEEWFSNEYGCQNDEDNQMFAPYSIYAYNNGDKNGQLREWQRPEQVELREAVNDYIERKGIACYRRIEKAIKTMKPPYEIE